MAPFLGATFAEAIPLTGAEAKFLLPVALLDAVGAPVGAVFGAVFGS